MKKANYTLIIILLLVINLSNATHAQVSINTDGNDADASSMLDVSSLSHGLLIPRMTLTERADIDLTGSPTGLLIYQTDNTPGFYYYNGNSWIAIQGGNDSDWTVSGNNMYSAVSGNVGIGTTSPAGLLHVKKELEFFDEALDQQQADYNVVEDEYKPFGQSFTAGTNGYLSKVEVWDEGTSEGDFIIKIYSGEGTGGNLIGTSKTIFVDAAISNPGYVAFEISTEISVSNGQQYTFMLERIDGYYWETRYSGNAPYSGGAACWNGEMYYNEDLIFQTYVAQSVTTPVSFILKNDGTMGVGTSSPLAKLHLKGNNLGWDRHIRLENSNDEDYANILFDDDGFKLRTFGNSYNYYFRNSDNTTNLFIDDGGNVGIGTSSPSNKLSVTGGADFDGDFSITGNVGIGTTSPLAKLHIKAMDLTVDRHIRLEHPSNSNHANIWLGDQGLKFRTFADGDSFYFLDNDNNPNLVIKDGGNVGIGTPSPICPLEVAGYSALYCESYGYLNPEGNTGQAGPYTVNYSIKAEHRVWASEFNAVSDRRIKTNFILSNTENDLSLINQIEVCDYTHIDTIGKGSDYKKGFIAQQLESVYPEAVKKTTAFIPDIYHFSTKVEEHESSLIITMETEHKLKKGDKLKFYSNSREHQQEVLQVVSPTQFRIAAIEDDYVQLFIFGKEVDDFRSIDYDQVFSIGIGALQELSNKIDELEKSYSYLQSKVEQVDKLTAEVEALKSLLTQENNLACTIHKKNGKTHKFLSNKE